MKKSISLILCTLICTVMSAQTPNLHSTPQPSEKENFYYIDNGIVRLGVDMNAGGSVFYFAEVHTGRNLLNHFDKGRFIQQSYYGAVDGSVWGEQPWRWNPIQGGGYKGEPAKIMKQNLSKRSIYIRSRPKQWASGVDAMDAYMEEKIVLKGNVAHIHYTFHYTGEVTQPECTHELPAVFVDYALPKLQYYDGKNPWNGEALSVAVPGWPNESRNSSENWAAYTDDNNWGIGVYTPGTCLMTSYRYDGDKSCGPKGAACSYFAPLRKFAIEPGMVFEYDVYLVIGEVGTIRETFGTIHKKISPRN